jgi:putative FmdB family regulatory protein
MPIYEYECKECSCKFEVLHKVEEENSDLICPKCNAKNPVRVLSVFSSGESSCGTTSGSVKKGFS